MKIIAIIKFQGLRKESGAWRPMSGIRPHLKVKDKLTSCTIWGDKDDQIFEPDIEYKVRLELLFSRYNDEMYVGRPVQLSQGSRVLAVGTIVEINR